MNALVTLAHGSIEGIGDLWNGVFHPLRSLSHLLVLLTLGLICGQRLRFKGAILAFLAGALGGLCATQLPRIPEAPSVLPCALAALGGAVLVLRLPVKRRALGAFFAVAGAVLGWDSAPDEGAPVWTVLKLLAGTWIGLSLLILNLANYAAMCPRKRWIKIAFRALGSWIIAISIMTLAFALRR